MNAHDPWERLEHSLSVRYAVCEATATPDSILLAVLNAVAEARKPAPEPAPVAQAFTPDASGLDRWSMLVIDGKLHALLVNNGEYVKHADHARIVAELRRGIVERGDDVIVPQHLYLEINAVGAQWEARAEQAEASLAACRADAERLDYLIATGKRISRTDGGRYRVMGLDGISEWQTEKDTGRAAIDAAIKESGNG